MSGQVGSITWSEPAPSVLKKLLVADAGWQDMGSLVGGLASQMAMQNAAQSRPSPRNATYEDIARALNVSEAALLGFLARPHLQEMAARPALTEEDAKADLAGEPRPSANTAQDDYRSYRNRLLQWQQAAGNQALMAQSMFSACTCAMAHQGPCPSQRSGQ